MTVTTTPVEYRPCFRVLQSMGAAAIACDTQPSPHAVSLETFAGTILRACEKRGLENGMIHAWEPHSPQNRSRNWKVAAVRRS